MVEEAKPAAATPAQAASEPSASHANSTMFSDSSSDSSNDSDEGKARSRSPFAGASAVYGCDLAKPGPHRAIGDSVDAVGSHAVSSAGGGRACSPAAQADWQEELQAIIQEQQRALGRQCRPLIHHSMYTGMNTQAMCFRTSGVDVVDVVGAEKKESGRWFMAANRLLPRKLFTCAHDMLQEGIAPGEPGYERADVFTAGFPCQPWSKMARLRFDPPSHTMYKEFENMMAYIVKTEPRACLLENVPSFFEQWEHNGVQSSDFEVLTERLRRKYHITWVLQDLAAWVQIRRRRVFMWCLHHDIADAQVAEKVSALAAHIEEQRKTFPPASMAQFVFAPGTEEFRSKVLGLGRPHRAATCCTRADKQGGEGKAAWQQETEAIRTALRQAGCPDAGAHPLRNASLLGLAATRRQREILECVLLLRCHHCGLSATCPTQLGEARRGLTWDISQNVPHHAAKAHVTTAMSSLCTGSIIYSFAHDRCLHEEELLAGMGWPSIAVPGMNRQDMRGLIGESQAIPCLAVVTWSLLLVLGNSLPGLWSTEA